MQQFAEALHGVKANFRIANLREETRHIAQPFLGPSKFLLPDDAFEQAQRGTRFLQMFARLVDGRKIAAPICPPGLKRFSNLCATDTAHTFAKRFSTV